MKIKITFFLAVVLATALHGQRRPTIALSDSGALSIEVRDIVSLQKLPACLLTISNKWDTLRVEVDVAKKFYLRLDSCVRHFGLVIKAGYDPVDLDWLCSEKSLRTEITLYLPPVKLRGKNRRTASANSRRVALEKTRQPCSEDGGFDPPRVRRGQFLLGIIKTCGGWSSYVIARRWYHGNP